MIDQHKSLSEKFIKKGFWLYLFSFIIAPIGYIIKIIISGELTVSELGILYGVLGLVILVSGFNDFGMTESLNHFLPKYITEKKYDKVKSLLAYAFLTQILTGSMIACFFYFGADYIAIHYFKTEGAIITLKIFSFFFLGINIFQIISTFFQSIQNTLYQKIIDFVRMISTMIFVLLIFFSDLSNLINLSYTWIIGLYFGIIFAIIIFYNKYYKTYFKNIKIIWSKTLFKKIFSYAILVFIGSQAATILGQIDMQMIIYLLSTTEAGYYTNYLSIIGIPFMLIGPIFGLLFPIFSEMHAKKEYKKIKIVKEIFVNKFTKIAIAFNILFFVFSSTIAYVLFGEKYLFSGEILKYSILFLIFNFLLQINFNILAGIGKVGDRVKIILMAIILNFITNIIFINYIGVTGAALATGLGWIFIYITSEFYLGKKYFIKIDYISLFKNIIFMGILGLLSYYYITPLFEGLTRGVSFFLLLIIGSIWFFIFGLINYKEFIFFIKEIKQIKRG